MNRLFDFLSLGIGCILFLIGGFWVWERYKPIRVSDTVIQKETTLPIQITIPSLSVRLPVIPAKYEKNSFQTTAHGVSYLSSTALPGTQGNSIFYGHNWPNLLGRLSDIRQGDEIIVTQGNAEIIYTVVYTSVVAPNETHIQNNTTDMRLTLYTCTGFLDQKRFVATATLKDTEIKDK